MFPLDDVVKTKRFPVITLLLIAINVLVFYFQLSGDNELIIVRYALIPQLVNLSLPETWLPFLTSMFLHGGFIHLLSNMWFLWVFGDNVEERLGLAYLPFYLLGGIVASLSQYLVMSNEFIPILGASGAVAAVLGAYQASFPKHQIRTLIFIGIPIIVLLPSVLILGYWFVIQLFNGVASFADTAATGGVAWFAHIGGFVFGYLGAKLLPSVGARRDY